MPTQSTSPHLPLGFENKRGNFEHRKTIPGRPLRQIDRGSGSGQNEHLQAPRCDENLVTRQHPRLSPRQSSTNAGRFGESVGADTEVRAAKEIGMTVYYSIDEVPDVGNE